MKTLRMKISALLIGTAAITILIVASPLFAQVNPAEIANPRLKAAQTAYFTQIKALYKEINETRFPFTFALGRYVGLDPARQAESDARGIEFVFFHDRLILKISGSYNAAYNATQLTQNQRASRTFSDVIAPTLLLAAKNIPADVDCDGIGFEISFHTRTRSSNFDFEGKEILVVVFNRVDAFAYAEATTDSQRQEILNRTQVFLDGKDFGLALGKKDPLAVDSLDRTPPPPISAPRSPAGPATSNTSSSRLVSPALMQPAPRPQIQSDIAAPSAGGGTAVPPVTGSAPSSLPTTGGNSSVAPTAADIDRLQAQFQVPLDALAKLGAEKFHFVNYAPPSFVVFRNQVMLQITLRNTIHFSQESTSLYKRAAQSFDLFLAGQLKDILDKVPGDAPFAGYDITILNQFGMDGHSSSEAIEFICPRAALRQFVDADITNQQLIDQSVVLVNGVRVALNLQLVE
jgi:hypothetical protein